MAIVMILPSNVSAKYRTIPLGGHDGRFTTLKDVVDHYDNHLRTSLSASEKQDLVEYLKSL